MKILAWGKRRSSNTWVISDEPVTEQDVSYDERLDEFILRIDMSPYEKDSIAEYVGEIHFSMAEIAALNLGANKALKAHHGQMIEDQKAEIRNLEEDLDLVRKELSTKNDELNRNRFRDHTFVLRKTD